MRHTISEKKVFTNFQKEKTISFYIDVFNCPNPRINEETNYFSIFDDNNR